MNTVTETVDGALSLDDQQSALRFKEAQRFELIAYSANSTKPPQNVAELKDLPLGTPAPSPLTLRLGPLPEGQAVFWNGTIYERDAGPKEAFAFR
jgi:hypothetical protein